MLGSRRAATYACGLLSLAMLAGCAGSERALVSFSYVVQPTRGLPEGMTTLAIMPAKLGPTTDAKWSDMCVTIMNSLVNESRNSFGTPINVSDRRDTQVTFDEADLAAAGMSDGSPGQGGRLEHIQGAILSNINVKIEKHVGKQRTLSGLDLWGGGGHGWGQGGGDFETEEVETVMRNVTVQTEFKLVDTANNRVWEHYLPRTYKSTERTKASPIFGSSQTEAELTPTDGIIATLVERGAREFISRLMACRIDVEAEVESSANANSVDGVKLLRAEEYAGAISHFRTALVEKPNDHRSAFGAGVAAEASGKYNDALRFYKQACAGHDSPVYRDARDRMKAYADRVR
ncbi:MAG: hypothetical protein KJ749_03165, partial [Planctomycetes bacterium]|nr:hypothetical protein [Planctomycetota bacterium]